MQEPAEHDSHNDYKARAQLKQNTADSNNQHQPQLPNTTTITTASNKFFRHDERE
jgi:hypothetical protein